MINKNEILKFENALYHHAENSHKRYNIGTYKEGTLHMILKHFITDDESMHEVNIDGHVADVYMDGTVYEVQTSAFGRLKDKLTCFLPEHKVVIVYPICTKKLICKTDSKTGEILSERVSPLKGKADDIFTEMCYIKDFLSHPNLSFMIILYEGTQLKFESKTVKVGRKKTDKYDTVPKKLNDIIKISDKNGYLDFIPNDLTQEFTLTDYIASSGKRRMISSSILYAAYHAGALHRVGRRGREYLYKRYNSV